MIVSSSGKVIAGSRILINESINEFLGTVNNLWNNAANWSLGVVPAANQIAIIRANCVLNTTTPQLRATIIDFGITLTINSAGGVNLYVREIINNGTMASGLVPATGNSSMEVGNFVNGLGIITNTNVNHILRLSISNKLEEFTINAAFFAKISGDFGIQFIGSYISSTGLSGTINIEALDAIEIGKSAFSLLVQKSAPNTYKTVVKGNLINFKSITINGTAHNIQFNAECTLIEAQAQINLSGNNVPTTFLGNTTFKCNSLFGQQSLNIPINCPVEFRNNGIGKPYVTSSYLGLPLNVHHIKIYDELDIPALLDFHNTVINGMDAASKLNFNNTVYNFHGNQGTNVNDFMAVGIVENMPAQFNYAFSGNQNIKALSTYKQLGIHVSGVKKLLGNTTCEHLYFSGTATLDLNGYTISGYTKYTDTSVLNRDVFTSNSLTEMNFTAGIKTLTNNVVTETLNYSSNVLINLNSFSLTITGKANWQVNQSSSYLTPLSGVNYGVITLGYTGAGQKVILQENLNVDIIIMNGSTQTSQFFINENGHSIICNDWRYTSNEPQFMYGRIYPNLIIGGVGTKTLLGNIVVNGSYTKLGTPIINKNGFTIKDTNGNDLE